MTLQAEKPVQYHARCGMKLKSMVSLSSSGFDGFDHSREKLSPRSTEGQAACRDREANNWNRYRGEESKSDRTLCLQYITRYNAQCDVIRRRRNNENYDYVN